MTTRAAASLTAIALVVGVVVVALVAAMSGQYAASIGEVWHALVPQAVADPDDARRTAAVLWSIRFPRVALALLTGACLAVAGSVLQAVFTSPLAEPSIVGINSSAAAAASIALSSGIVAVAPWTFPAAAFAGAVVIVLLVWWLARTPSSAKVLTLVLTGVAINAMAAAVAGLAPLIGDPSARESLSSWLTGSLSGASWSSAAITAAVFAVGFALALGLRRSIDVLALGDAVASASGVAVPRVRAAALAAVCLLTGVAVAYGGIIAFVGLIVPQGLRLVVGPAQRRLIPLSALGGALFVTAADLIARTAVPLAEVPLGILTALVGGPVFLLLLRRTVGVRR